MLDEFFESLDLNRGQLLYPAASPNELVSADDWRSAGEWLILAERMGAERVFFVEDNPVIVFSEISGVESDHALVNAYRQAWSMARPRCLFITTDDEIRVYSLAAPPVDSASRVDELTPLQVVSRTADVAEQLADFRRDKVEDGSLFERPAFRDHLNNAAEQFLADVDAATRVLERQGLDPRVAHGLIERVVLIRYLEDREVLTPEYFNRIAGRRRLTEQLPAERGPEFGPSSAFLRCLSDIDLTRDVFEDLARTFNGDLFMTSDEEQSSVSTRHLLSIQQLFSGRGFDTDQEPLFLWAYDFSVVPTSLISSMYEQFYHADSNDDSGTYYTPPELVEYVLGRTLTEDVLNEAPRICDAACGSGIFLVEAFRRVVRHEMVANPNEFSPRRLRELLIERVAGVDTNGEAVRLAAFSLYLAYLNYLSPRDILTADPLPRLISRENSDGEATVLVISDAFNETTTEASEMLSDLDAIPWSNGSFDVVLGNPPWTEPHSPVKTSLPDRWARIRGLPVGDRSLSQLFLWRALSLLRDGGTGSLLVGATTFHNARSIEFRREWTSRVDIQAVVNFTAARRLFFNNAIAPFVLAQFRKRPPGEDNRPQRQRFEYLTMVPSSALANSGSLVYARSERKWLDQDSLLSRDYLWKTYFWGSHRDAALMARLDVEQCLRDVLPDSAPAPAYGYQWGDRNVSRQPSDTLAALPSLKQIEVLGPIRDSLLEPVNRPVKREPNEQIYFGPRILVSRGIQTGFGPRVRFVSEPLAFRHNIYCIPAAGLPVFVAKALTGILLSSLGRYRVFMTSGSWGFWHDSVVPADILNIPVRIEDRWNETLHAIADSVDQLQSRTELDVGLFEVDGPSTEEVFESLDRLVFALFELNESEQALVNDFHRYTLDLVTNQEASTALRPIELNKADMDGGTQASIAGVNSEISEYLSTFLSVWDRELAPDGQFTWRLHSSERSPLIAALFETQVRGDELELSSEDWDEALGRLAAGLSIQVSQSVRTEGVARSVSDSSVLIIKRNEARLWSSSAAMEDAEATMLQAMALGD